MPGVAARSCSGSGCPRLDGRPVALGRAVRHLRRREDDLVPGLLRLRGVLHLLLQLPGPVPGLFGRVAGPDPMVKQRKTPHPSRVGGLRLGGQPPSCFWIFACCFMSFVCFFVCFLMALV